MSNTPQLEQISSFEIPLWPYAHGGPIASGKIRCKASDFYVDELLGYDLTGSGEHIWLQLQKTELNTDQVAQNLARFAGVKPVDIGYAGLKDRNAVTRQWFSVRLPGKIEPDWSGLNSESLSIVKISRNKQKLKRGALAGNAFRIIIRDWQASGSKADTRLSAIQKYGIPNYFGPQRFGRGGQNINKAIEMFHGKRFKRHQRSMYLSSVRSLLFNEIVAERVKLNNWNKAMAGDTYQFNQSRQIFATEKADERIHSRLKELDIHSVGSLFGQGESINALDAAKLEAQIFARYPELTSGLLANSVDRSYRAMRVKVEKLQWAFIDDNSLQLSFQLPAGSYATSVLRELVILEK